jgi:serine/threonine-protein kinase
MGGSPARAASLDVGSVIDDTYTIEALIGRGGMGSVFLASHTRLPGKQVAIKVLHPDVRDDDVLARFKREAEIASRLDHPNIVQVHDINELPDGSPYLLMEYLEGETLAQRLRSGPLPIDVAFSIVRQVGSALAAAHRAGIVHRDLKPQNVFLVPTEIAGRTVEIAKVLDFGISKIRGSTTVKTQEAALLGTPQYMAPEQAKGEQTLVDERTDVFALGAIVYEMVSGKPAFHGDSIPEVVFKVVYEQPAPLAATTPRAIADAIARAMAKPAAERFDSVSAFVEALTGEPLPAVRALRTPVPGDVAPSTGRNRSTPHSSGSAAFAATVGSQHDQVRIGAPTVSSVPPPPARRARWPLVIGACVLAGGGALAMYLAMRGGDDKPRDAERVVRDDPPKRMQPIAPVPPPSPPPPISKPADVPPVDAGVPVATSIDAAPAPVPPPPHPVRPDRAEPKPEGKADPLATQALHDAEAAIRGGDWELAERRANSVFDMAEATDYQRAYAHALAGIVACHLHNDQEKLQINLRGIKYPALRRKLLAGCRSENVVMPDPDQ